MNNEGEPRYFLGTGIGEPFLFLGTNIAISMFVHSFVCIVSSIAVLSLISLLSC